MKGIVFVLIYTKNRLKEYHIKYIMLQDNMKTWFSQIQLMFYNTDCL